MKQVVAEKSGEQYLKDKKAAAQFLGVSVATINRWITEKRGGPVHIKIGNLVKFLPEDLMAFVESRRVQQ